MIGVGDLSGRRSRNLVVEDDDVVEMGRRFMTDWRRIADKRSVPPPRFRIAVDWNGTLAERNSGVLGLKRSACEALRILDAIGGELFIISFVGKKNAHLRSEVIDGVCDVCHITGLQYEKEPRREHSGSGTLAMFFSDSRTGRAGKGAICERHKITAIVDDRDEILRDCAQYGVAPYRCSQTDPDDCRRSILLAAMDIFDGLITPLLGQPAPSF